MKRAKASGEFYAREFLNEPGWNSVAAVFAKVEPNGLYPALMLSDCGRQVSFDVCLSSGDVDNSLHKLDVMVGTLTEFRKACYNRVGRTAPKL